MPTLEDAIRLAAAAHAGQTDKAGQPYILHPIKVMLRMQTLAEQMAAVLHDVVEDTDVTLDQLRAEGYPAEVVAAVDALTKRPGENRVAAAKRAAVDAIARRVKLADNAENMDLTRIPNPSARDHERIAEYRVVRELLLSAENG